MAKQHKSKHLDYAIGVMRLGLGLIFAWAFADKLWGLGHATCRNGETGVVDSMCSEAWISGGSPTSGFLQFATSGPFQDTFSSLAGVAVVDWLFMLALLLLGVSLVLGIGVNMAAVGGSVLMLLMWAATFPPQNHPFMDDHVIYALALIVILMANGSQKLGFGKRWAKLSMVKKYKWLR